MGRKLNPIEDDGPIGGFAQRLRDRRHQAGEPTFRAMAAVSSCSHAVLAEACAGKKLPTWEVTEAFVRALRADDELPSWRKDWRQVQQAVGRLRRKLGQADVVVPTHSDTGLPIREGRLRPVQPDLADPAASMPRPETAQTFDDLLYQARVLKIAVGNPSLRQLKAQLRKLEEYIGVSTLGDLLSGRRPPSHELFRTVICGLLAYGDVKNRKPAETWFSLQVWLEAWTRAEYNRTRPDLARRRRTGNVYLMSENQDEGPTAGVIGEMNPSVAATLLGSLPRPIAAGIINELPPEKAQAVIKARCGT